MIFTAHIIMLNSLFDLYVKIYNCRVTLNKLRKA